MHTVQLIDVRTNIINHGLLRSMYMKKKQYRSCTVPTIIMHPVYPSSHRNIILCIRILPDAHCHLDDHDDIHFRLRLRVHLHTLLHFHPSSTPT